MAGFPADDRRSRHDHPYRRRSGLRTQTAKESRVRRTVCSSNLKRTYFKKEAQLRRGQYQKGGPRKPDDTRKMGNRIREPWHSGSPASDKVASATYVKTDHSSANPRRANLARADGTLSTVLFAIHDAPPERRSRS